MTDIDRLIADRAPQNGDYSETAAIAQNIKAAMRESENWKNLPAIHLEALEMIANKVARILNGDMMHPDHWLDIEGYARLVYVRISDEHAAEKKEAEPSRSLQPSVVRALERLAETA